ncbi:MAG: L,D-transpeptidase family protein [Afipia sp.]|nr:L,D-transpeptidase family protein [Afipia sp.]
MFNRLLATTALLSAGVAAMPLLATSSSAQSYPPPPGYSQPLQTAPYDSPPVVGDARGAPDFDRLDDEDGMDRGTSLSPPGYQQQPNYRQATPRQPLTYEQQGYTGPILSPDDPRYGKPAGAPVPPHYSDRGPPQQSGAPQDGSPRPPGAIDANQTGAVEPRGPAAVGADGKTSVMSILPADEQPETGPRKQLDARLRRQEVNYPTKEPAGTIIVDTPNTQLYYILGGGRAIRYGVRVGRDGFTWTGVQKITRKAEWPDWHPPPEMIDRQPYLPRFMAGGDGNPLGARAMYLGNTVYRIHGTNQPSTIGKFVSSGCIGMLNEDVTDLFDRVKVGTRVVVLPGGPPPGAVTASATPQSSTGYGPGANGAPGAVPAANGGGPVVPAPNAAMGVPNQGPTVVPPLPAPVVVR